MDITRSSELEPTDARFTQLCEDACAIIETGRARACRAINTAMVYSYYELGRRIVEEEQGGAARAGYGSRLLENLATALTERYGRGFSKSALKQIRRFYLVYSADEIGQTLFAQFTALPKTRDGRVFPLSWSHYLKLMRIKNVDERLENESPTIGIVLCKDKSDSMVELTLPEDNEQIFASRYQTVLPSKEEPRKLMDKSAAEFAAEEAESRS